MYSVVLGKRRPLFSIDTRSLALFRICCSLYTIYDLYKRTFYGVEWHTDNGILEPHQTPHKSIFHQIWFYRGSVLVQQLLFVVHFIVACNLCIGYKTRLFSFFHYLFAISIQERMYYILDGGDRLFRNIAFWLMFLPSWVHFAVDAIHLQKARKKACLVALYNTKHNNNNNVNDGENQQNQQNESKNKTEKTNGDLHCFRSFGTAGILIQCTILYPMILCHRWHGIHQTWHWNTCTAVHHSMASYRMSTDYGLLLAGYPYVCFCLCRLTLICESILPMLLLFVPYDNIRMLVLLVLVGMHITFNLFIRIECFLFVILTSLVLFIPPLFWELAERFLFRISMQLGIYVQYKREYQRVSVIVARYLQGPHHQTTVKLSNVLTASIEANENEENRNNKAKLQNILNARANAIAIANNNKRTKRKQVSKDSVLKSETENENEVKHNNTTATDTESHLDSELDLTLHTLLWRIPIPFKKDGWPVSPSAIKGNISFALTKIPVLPIPNRFNNHLCLFFVLYLLMNNLGDRQLQLIRKFDDGNIGEALRIDQQWVMYGPDVQAVTSFDVLLGNITGTGAGTEDNGDDGHMHEKSSALIVLTDLLYKGSKNITAVDSVSEYVRPYNPTYNVPNMRWERLFAKSNGNEAMQRSILTHFCKLINNGDNTHMHLESKSTSKSMASFLVQQMHSAVWCTFHGEIVNQWLQTGTEPQYINERLICETPIQCDLRNH